MLSNKEIMKSFFSEVRSGKNVTKAPDFMAPRMIAHQMIAENVNCRVERTPNNYADHVRDMQATYGKFELTVQEIIAEGDRVYVRWLQTGNHLKEIEGYPPTGKEVREMASAVYRLENGKIAEYWIQIDRQGLLAQLQANRKSVP